MQLTVNDSVVQLPDPVDDKLQESLWSRLEKVPAWLPASFDQGEKAQFMIAAATAANIWYKAAYAKATDEQVPVDVASLRKCVFNAAVIGLLPVDRLGLAYFVPMHVDKRSPRSRIECQLWIGYKGFIELARTSDVIETIFTQIVWKDEPFKHTVDENGPHLHHEPSMDRPDKIDMKDIRAAYCLTRTPSGQPDFEIVNASTLRQLSKRGNVWRSNPVEMARKSPVRRMANRWPQTNRLANAVRLDEQAEADERQAMLVPEKEEIPKAAVAIATEAVPEWMGALDQKLQGAKGPAECEMIREEFAEGYAQGPDEVATVNNVVDDYIRLVENDLAES